MKIPLVAIAAVLLLGGCASMKSSAAGYQARLETLRGVHIDEVVLAWGPPDGEFTFEDGRRMYAFVSSRLVSAPRMTPGFLGLGRFYGRGFYDDWPPMETRHYFCETRLITDKDYRVIDWNFRGNACRAVPPAEPGPAPSDASHLSAVRALVCATLGRGV